MRKVPYSKFNANIAALIGIEQANLQSQELVILNTFFNKNMKYAWQQSNWVDLCPYGEYVSTNAYMSQSFTPVSLYQNYFGIWMRSSTNADVPIQVVRLSDGNLVATQTFSLTNVWQFCLIPFNPLDLTLHRVQVGGSNLLTAGLTFFVWQASAVDTYSITGGIIIPYSQVGAPQIDIPITIWKDSPFNAQPARRVGYRLTDKGIKINDQATNFNVTNNFVLTTNTSAVP